MHDFHSAFESSHYLTAFTMDAVATHPPADAKQFYGAYPGRPTLPCARHSGLCSRLGTVRRSGFTSQRAPNCFSRSPDARPLLGPRRKETIDPDPVQLQMDGPTEVEPLTPMHRLVYVSSVRGLRFHPDTSHKCSLTNRQKIVFLHENPSVRLESSGGVQWPRKRIGRYVRVGHVRRRRKACFRQGEGDGGSSAQASRAQSGWLRYRPPCRQCSNG
jgi:hypothetical protein